MGVLTPLQLRLDKRWPRLVPHHGHFVLVLTPEELARIFESTKGKPIHYVLSLMGKWFPDHERAIRRAGMTAKLKIGVAETVFDYLDCNWKYMPLWTEPPSPTDGRSTV